VHSKLARRSNTTRVSFPLTLQDAKGVRIHVGVKLFNSRWLSRTAQLKCIFFHGRIWNSVSAKVANKGRHDSSNAFVDKKPADWNTVPTTVDEYTLTSWHLRTLSHLSSRGTLLLHHSSSKRSSASPRLHSSYRYQCLLRRFGGKSTSMKSFGLLQRPTNGVGHSALLARSVHALHRWIDTARSYSQLDHVSSAGCQRAGCSAPPVCRASGRGSEWNVPSSLQGQYRACLCW